MNSVVYKRSINKPLIAIGAISGYVLGGIGAYRVTSTIGRPIDYEIIEAFDKRFVKSVLNTTGFGSNYLSTQDYKEDAYKKPYWYKLYSLFYHAYLTNH